MVGGTILIQRVVSVQVLFFYLKRNSRGCQLVGCKRAPVLLLLWLGRAGVGILLLLNIFTSLLIRVWLIRGELVRAWWLNRVELVLLALLSRLVGVINADLLAAEEATHIDGARVFLTRSRLALVVVISATTSDCDVNDLRKVALAVTLLFLLVQGLTR